ncbi:MAG: hypothetical protein KAI83_09570 [Thiomargarita sp.]|nr:hypothetical protein [Thiomargarita sp.]
MEIGVQRFSFGSFWSPTLQLWNDFITARKFGECSTQSVDEGVPKQSLGTSKNSQFLKF